MFKFILFIIVILIASVSYIDAINVLMFAYVPPQYVTETIEYWADTLMLDGFIIGNICEWYQKEDYYSLRTDELVQFSTACRENGIQYNFLKIALGYKEFPAWHDTVAIKRQCNNIIRILDWAKKVGFYGICFDTEPYTVPLWDKGSERFKYVDVSDIKRGFEIFSSKISEKLEREDLELLIIPEGNYFSLKKYGSKYQLWSDFISGFLENESIHTIIVGCEYTYKKIDYNSIKKYSKQLFEFQNDKIKYAYGAWPLGYYKAIKNPLSDKTIFLDSNLSQMKNSWLDKSPNYSSLHFQKQLDNFHDFSNEWIWIYSHGSAWWSLTDKKYKYIWKPENQFLSPNKEIKSYIDVLWNFKKENE